VVGLLIARRVPSIRVIGIELQKDLARHAAANARANGLAARCHVVQADLRQARRFLPPEHFDRVVANPPFRKEGSGAVPPDPARAGARLETTFSIADLAEVAAALLRFGGSLDVIHLVERLPELIVSLAACGIQPKVLRLVAPFPDTPPRLCLLTGIKGGQPGLRALPQLAIHERPGPYTEEVLALLDSGHRRDDRAEKPPEGN
jgi:tRNA1Val (adenine37-N6)-methyltransferase